MGKEILVIIMLFLLAVLVIGIETRPDEIDGPPAITGGAGNIIPQPTNLEPVTSDLHVFIEIDCWDSERNNIDGEDPRNLIFARKEYHDDPNAVGTLPYQVYYNGTFPVSWTGGPNVSLPQLDALNNPFHVRYEGRQDYAGGCFLYGRTVHDEYLASVYQSTYDSDWSRITEWEYYVDWDNNDTSCNALGGAWLGGYGCCGDDWIWVNNLAVDYDLYSTQQRLAREVANELCLYSKNPDYGRGVDGEIWGLGTTSYFCDDNMVHAAYDSYLDLDDPLLNRGSPDEHFFFAGEGETETDLGKHSDYNDTNPMVCNMYFDNSAGEGVKFEWLPEATAAGRSQLLCEVFLGYNWTGSQCCGASGSESYSDTAKECDGDLVYNQLRFQYGDNFINHPAFRVEFNRLCDDYMNQAGYAKNRACYENSTVDNNSVLYMPDTTGPIFNENGNLFSCDTAPNPYGFPVVPSCGSKGDIAICTHANDTWYTAHGSPSDYSYEILGYRDDDVLYPTRDDIVAAIHESTIPASVPVTEYDYATECCFSNACWDGTQCVDRDMKYQLLNDVWEEYDYNAIADKEVYVCRDGSWIGPLDLQYNWYWDTEHPDYCVDDDQCACSTDDCGGNNIDNGCTNTPGFFIDDNICEDRVWTSRTKLLATQLMTLAGNDYTLFCDSYDLSTNYFDPIVPIAEDINSICVLNDSTGVIVGVSFNADGADPFALDVDNALFNADTGFVNAVLGENLIDCSDAIVGSDTNGYGSFKRCSSSNDRVYYNNKTQILLYAKHGLGSGTLTWNYNTYNSQIESMFSDISSHIGSNEAAINSHTDIQNIAVFENAHKFAGLYIAENQGATVFGTVETLYDPEKDGNRFYLGMVYSDVSNIDCNTITTADRSAYCGTGGSDIFVIERRTDVDFRFWRDLSSKLRFRN